MQDGKVLHNGLGWTNLRGFIVKMILVHVLEYQNVSIEMVRQKTAQLSKITNS
jgi:hypothetical protein